MCPHTDFPSRCHSKTHHFSIHKVMDLSSTKSWISKQNRNNLSTNKIKNYFILPLHSHLHLFHGFESWVLDITPNCKVTDHFHRRPHHLSPLTCCQLKKSLQTASAKLPAQRNYQCYGLAWPSPWYKHSMEARGAAEKSARLWSQIDSNSQVDTAVQEAPLLQKQWGQPHQRKGWTAGQFKWHSWSWEG